MIKMTYIPLPIVSTAYRFLYKLEGDVNLDWTFGQITVALTLSQAHKSQEEQMQDYARNTASLIHANANCTTRYTEQFKDTEVEFIPMETKPVEPYTLPPYMQPTDTLIVEYFQIPKMDEKIHFLFRFVSPINQVWTLQSADCLVRDIERGEDGHVKQFNRHVTVKEIINRDVMKMWNAMLKETMVRQTVNEQGVVSEDLPEEIRWMADINKVEMKECKLVKSELPGPKKDPVDYDSFIIETPEDGPAQVDAVLNRAAQGLIDDRQTRAQINQQQAEEIDRLQEALAAGGQGEG